LCGRADVILPNLTEAAFLLDRPYLEPGTYTEAQITDTLKRLCALGAKTAVLTGVSFGPKEIGFMSLNGETGETDAWFHPRVEAAFHGTGDIFASVTVGGLMLGKTLGESLRLAAGFTGECIRITAADPEGIRYGVYFEALLPELMKQLGK
ncbi:MAG: bifunctional hydroxymethylpyrimidine kinase/phosphomethylpyrimidine kinase, partial [Oscillospiraceae bacterium]|nr:bifunctional hydroxymethylpyrimidine kinase/phosphomethylpyrimidine kinase [Oscillospiraceae bacterium]